VASGLELSIAKTLAPIAGGLIKGATETASKSFKRWNASGASSKLAKKLAQADRIKTIWSPDKEKSLLSIYYPSRILVSKSPQNIASLSDLPNENLVIEGIVGHGKSIFLRYLYLQELSGNGLGCLPLFIELRTLSRDRDLHTCLLEALDKIDVDPSQEIFDYLAKSGKLVLLLDGFDELDEEIVRATIGKIEFLLDKYASLRIIVTSRPSAEIQKSRLFRTVSLVGLELEDYNNFLTKLGVKSEKALEIVEAIRNSPSDVSNLIKTPLMMTLLVMVYESENEIPSELPEFFDKLFSTMFARHDRLKAGFVRKHYSGLSERQLQRLFEVFCFFAMQKGYGRSLTTQQFVNAFDRACSHSSELQCDVDDFRKDIVRVACMMLEEGFDLTTFLHKSIAEYFAAAFVKRLSDELAEKFYRNVNRAYSNWSGMITFLEEIDEYRLAKYYWIPSLDLLFEQLSEEEHGEQRWLKFFVKRQPEFGVTYSLKNKNDEGAPFEATSWGSYTHHSSLGGEIHGKIAQAAISGLKETIPLSLGESVLLEQPHLFIREEKPEGKIEYKIYFDAAVQQYGSNGVVSKFEQLELDMLRRRDEAKITVEREEKKERMVADDFFGY